MSTTILVADVKVRQDKHGRFSLNDLHKAAVAAGANKRTKEPGKFLASPSVKDFIGALDSDAFLSCKAVESIKGGSDQGTYARKEIFIEYAMFLGGLKFKHKLISNLITSEKVLEALNEFEIPDDMPDMYVYAIEEVDTGNIKIGISRNPESRLRQLQTGNSSKLRLVACKPAENRYKDESIAHIANYEHRIHGEWFSSKATL